MNRQAGFTLIELLIAIALMTILIGAVTMIFIQTTETVAIQEARMTVYTNARYALDILENDLMSAVTFNAGIQQFYMENGKVATPGTFPVFNSSGGHVYDPVTKQSPADKISFIATTTVGDTQQTCMVTCELIPAHFALNATTGTPQTGDQSHKQTVRTNRGLYTLVRRIRVADPAVPVPPGTLPNYKNLPADRAGITIADQELCHYVLGFNLEYFASNLNFSQLDPSPFTSKQGGNDDPIGNDQGTNDKNTPGGAVTALRIPYIRVTLTIVEDVGERQERAITKSLWVPMG
jgi:prepilin-type N-terminal cleavage/methylation domain-containing protein